MNLYGLISNITLGFMIKKNILINIYLVNYIRKRCKSEFYIYKEYPILNLNILIFYDKSNQRISYTYPTLNVQLKY